MGSNFNLNWNSYIRKFFAIILLAIFALSNTPTKYLHQLFANHTDFITKTLSDLNTPQLHVSGIDCHCESNVVIAPYTPADSFEIEPVSTVFAAYIVTGKNEIVFAESLSFRLRGPPSIV